MNNIDTLVRLADIEGDLMAERALNQIDARFFTAMKTMQQEVDYDDYVSCPYSVEKLGCDFEFIKRMSIDNPNFQIQTRIEDISLLGKTSACKDSWKTGCNDGYMMWYETESKATMIDDYLRIEINDIFDKV